MTRLFQTTAPISAKNVLTINTEILQSTFIINARIKLGHDLDPSRSRDVIGHHIRSASSAIIISYYCPIGTEPLSLTVFDIFGPQNPCRASTHTHTHTHTHQ